MKGEHKDETKTSYSKLVLKNVENFKGEHDDDSKEGLSEFVGNGENNFKGEHKHDWKSSYNKFADKSALYVEGEHTDTAKTNYGTLKSVCSERQGSNDGSATMVRRVWRGAFSSKNLNGYEVA